MYKLAVALMVLMTNLLCFAGAFQMLFGGLDRNAFAILGLDAMALHIINPSKEKERVPKQTEDIIGSHYVYGNTTNYYAQMDRQVEVLFSRLLRREKGTDKYVEIPSDDPTFRLMYLFRDEDCPIFVNGINMTPGNRYGTLQLAVGYLEEKEDLVIEYDWGEHKLRFNVTAWPTKCFQPHVAFERDDENRVWARFSSEQYGIKIYYTLDGSIPKLDDLCKYDGGKVLVGEKCVISVLANRDGGLSSDVVRMEFDPNEFGPNPIKGKGSICDDSEGISISWLLWNDEYDSPGKSYVFCDNNLIAVTDKTRCYIPRKRDDWGVEHSYRVEKEFYNGTPIIHDEFNHRWRPIEVASTNIVFYKGGFDGTINVRTPFEDDTYSCQSDGSWLVASNNIGYLKLHASDWNGTTNRVAKVIVSQANAGRQSWSPVELMVTQKPLLAPVDKLRSVGCFSDFVLIAWDLPPLEMRDENGALKKYEVFRKNGLEKVFLGAVDCRYYIDRTVLPGIVYEYEVIPKEGSCYGECRAVSGMRANVNIVDNNEIALPASACCVEAFRMENLEDEIFACADWIQLSAKEEDGKSTYFIEVSSNSSPYSRTGTIGIRRGSGANEIKDYIWVVQRGLCEDVKSFDLIGPDRVFDQGAYAFNCRITYANGECDRLSPENNNLNGFQGEGVKYTLLSNDEHISVSAGGILVAKKVEHETEVHIGAWYVEHNVTNVAYKTVVVHPRPSLTQAFGGSCGLSCGDATAWRVSCDNEDVLSGVFGVVCDKPAILCEDPSVALQVEIGERCELSFWIKLSQEFVRTSDGLGQCIEFSFSDGRKKRIWYEDAPDWTKISMPILKNGDVVRIKHVYDRGSGLPMGCVRIGNIEKMPLTISGIEIIGEDILLSRPSAYEDGPVYARYMAKIRYGDFEDSITDAIPLQWRVEGDGVRIVGVNIGEKCVLVPDDIHADTRVKLCVSYIGDSAIEVKKDIVVRYVEPEIAIAEALSCSNLTFAVGGDKTWQGFPSVSETCGPAARSELKGRACSWIETSVPWGGALSFAFKNINGVLELQVDGECVKSYGTVDGWVRSDITLSKSPHTIRWVHRNGEEGVSTAWLSDVVWNQDAPQLKSISILSVADERMRIGEATTLNCMAEYDWGEAKFVTPIWGVVSGNGSVTLSGNQLSARSAGVVTICAEYAENGVACSVRKNFEVVSDDQNLSSAVGCASLSFTTGGDSVWHHQDRTYYDIGGAAQSGDLGKGQSCWMETTVRGPCKLSWYWKNDSWGVGDEIQVFVDGVLSERSGGTYWKQAYANLGEDREYIVKWLYQNQSGESAGLRHAWVDRVRLETLDEPTVVQSISIEGPVRVIDTVGHDYKCYAKYDNGQIVRITPTWSVVTGSDLCEITSRGVLWAEGAGIVRIKAVYSFGGKTCAAYLDVEVVKTLTGLRLIGPESISAGSHRSYQCQAKYNDGSEENVEAELSIVDIYRANDSRTNGFVRLDRKGILYSCTNDVGYVVLRASYTESGVTLSDELRVGVSAPTDITMHIEGENVLRYGSDGQYKTIITFGEDKLTAEVLPNWSVAAGVQCATISTKGVLTPKSSGEVSVRAYINHLGKFLLEEKSIAIAPNGVEKGILKSLFIEGPSSVEYGNCAHYNCFGVYENGAVSSVDAEWQVLNVGTNVWIEGDGVLKSRPLQGTMGEGIVKASIGSLSAMCSVSLTVHYDKIPIGQALGGSLQYECSDPTNWFGQTIYSFDGEGAARTLLNSKVKSASIKSCVSGSGSLSFKWSQKAQSVIRYVLFLVDGVQVAKLQKSDDFGWQSVALELGDGSHELEWRYVNESVNANATDWFAIDTVTWLKPPSLIGVVIEGEDVLGVGEQVTNYCVSVYDNGSVRTNEVATWRVLSGLEQVRVDANGIVSAEKSGMAKLSADAVIEGVCYTAEKMVAVERQGVDIQIEGSDLLALGSYSAYSCRVLYSDGSFESVVPNWSVEYGNVEIDNNGVVTPRVGGSAMLCAKYRLGDNILIGLKDINVVNISECIDCTNLSFVVYGDGQWIPSTERPRMGSMALVGRAQAPGLSTIVSTACTGSGEIGFSWRMRQAVQGDCFELVVDGVVRSRLETSSEWRDETVKVDGDNYHVIMWRYIAGKDSCDEFSGYGILDGVDWRLTSSQIIIPSEVTGSKELSVAESWVEKLEVRFGSGKRALFAERFGNDLSSALLKKTGKKDLSGNDMYVWQDYVAGTDPTNPEDLFRMTIEMVDGKPHVNWSPNLNAIGEERVYKVYGCEDLASGVWLSPPDALKHKFFKVDVTMPDGVCVTDVPGEVPERWNYVAVPTAITGLSYDGAEKSGVVSAIGYELSGNAATAAGSYSAIASLLSGYAWVGGSRDDCVIPWSIAKAENAWVTVPSMSSTSILAGSAVTISKGTAKFGTVTANYTAEDIAALSAGSYSYVCSVPGTSNYSALTKTIAFTVIDAIKVALPKAKTGLVYTGDTQTGVSAGTGYTLSGNTALNAGNYTATATLKDGYAWSDGNASKSRTIAWSIGKATNAWLTQPSISKTEFEEETAVTISLGAVKFGVRQANYTSADLSKLAPGEYTLTVSVAGTANYTGLTKSISFTVTTSTATTQALYCIVDLSAGPTAEMYPVSYVQDVPGGGWTDEYKTTKLVLRLIDEGSYQMSGKNMTILTSKFYMGIFEVTQKQYELVLGYNPASGRGVGDTYPVYKVSYDDIRGASAGAEWPNSQDVDGTSFLGKLRARTALLFDLPTDAQWEYACRAGTTESCYWEGTSGTVKTCSWNAYNSYGQQHPVGGKSPNAWGLYDIFGNASEWCRDWYGNRTYGEDPTGPLVGNKRIIRGGSYYDAEFGVNAINGYPNGLSDSADIPSERKYLTGFRLVILN